VLKVYLSTYYSSIEACFYDRGFRVEIMHGGSIFESQIETFCEV